MSNLLDDFTPNDLLYGLTVDRMTYLPLLDHKFGEGDYTIDRLTRACSLKAGFKKGWSKDDLIKNTDPDAHLPQDAQAFYEFALKSRFAAKMGGKGISDKTKTGVTKGYPVTSPYLRSKCKAGIEFVIDRGYKVRFVIDSLTEEELSKIFKKEFEQPWYTGAELRYLYKNWAQLKQKVVFYFNCESCEPPWIKYPNAM